MARWMSWWTRTAWWGVAYEAEAVQCTQGLYGIPGGDRGRVLGEVLAGSVSVLGNEGKGGLAGQDGLGNAIGIQEGSQLEHGPGQAGRAEGIGPVD
ncbi:hypothetical protein MUU72_32555 [Streptomyces sp. RS10V-4]|uniref:hypothetical protein n=1 Tax=Streptomyces rhizoryzae TaxID=2932493 RepID=UPI002004B4BC|nr:hypothetical protein [Streptomyces rhizoryzae]MCK7627773.1 hypothetical protein [Streptomyces rhizoryzae]